MSANVQPHYTHFSQDLHMPCTGNTLRHMESPIRDEPARLYAEIDPALFREFTRFKQLEGQHKNRLVSQALWWFMQMGPLERRRIQDRFNEWRTSGAPPLEFKTIAEASGESGAGHQRAGPKTDSASTKPRKRTA